jgi:hypothetical protein
VEVVVRLYRSHEFGRIESVQSHEPSESKDVTQRISNRRSDTADLHVSPETIEIGLRWNTDTCLRFERIETGGTQTELRPSTIKVFVLIEIDTGRTLGVGIHAAVSRKLIDLRNSTTYLLGVIIRSSRI